MAAQLIANPFRPVINLQGGFEAGALLDVFTAGTTTRVSVYTTDALTTELPNPVVANSVGSFPPVYYNDGVAIRVRVRAADGSLIPNGDTDPYIPDGFNAEAFADQAGVSAVSAAASAVTAATSATNAGTSASAAAASAATAVLSPGTSATSTTSLLIGTGSKSLTIETGKAFALGQFVLISRTSAPNNWMFGQITAFTSGTGALTVNAQATNGSGTFTDWTVALSGPSGSVGVVDIVSGTTGTLTVARGGTGATTAAGARTALGSTTVGDGLFTLANPSAVRFLRVNADNSVSARTAAELRGDIAAAASGANTDITSLARGTTLTASGTVAADTLGFRGLPANAQTGGYTLVLDDAGRMVTNTTGGWAIPANGTTAFPVGTTIVLYNNSGSAQNITITTDTLRQAGTANTGTRSLAARGFATLVKVAATEWVASGDIT